VKKIKLSFTFPKGRKSGFPPLPSLLPHLLFFPKIKPFPREENQAFPPFTLRPLPRFFPNQLNTLSPPGGCVGGGGY